MGKKKDTWKNRQGVVYSTNEKFDYESDNPFAALSSSSSNKPTLYVSLDKKKRGGKQVTLVEGFSGSESNLKDLGKILKSKCGVGGSAKDGEIIVQGDHRDKVVSILEQEGYAVKRKGG